MGRDLRAGTISATTGLVTGGAATAGASQPAVVTASIGTVTCTANVNVYGTLTATTSIRVVVIDEDTKVPVPGAFVVLDSNTAGKQTTAADGSAVFTVATAGGTHNVHAFAANHDYASYIGVLGTDLLIPLRQFYPIPRARSVRRQHLGQRLRLAHRARPDCAHRLLREQHRGQPARLHPR